MDTIQNMEINELSPERREDRDKIAAIYRKAIGRNVGLGASEDQWAFFEALLNFGRETFRYTFDGIDPNDQTLLDIIKDAEGAIEMTDEEQFRMYETEVGKGRLWTKATSGVMPTIGYIADMPITIMLTWVIWEGHKFVLWYMPSTVVDHRMGRKFLRENLPPTAFESPDRLNHANAANAINALHTAKHMKEAAA